MGLTLITHEVVHGRVGLIKARYAFPVYSRANYHVLISHRRIMIDFTQEFILNSNNPPGASFDQKRCMERVSFPYNIKPRAILGRPTVEGRVEKVRSFGTSVRLII